MLKTRLESQLQFVTQPDHGALAGYLAAHWGNGQFSMPGDFAPAVDPSRLRSEVIFGIAEHDNGWWEWEATPDLSESDRLPVGLTEVLRARQEGMDRWRRGIPRFRTSHPYGSLLTSWHAFWLYAPAVDPSHDPAFRHPIFWRDEQPKVSEAEAAETKSFLNELNGLQSELMARLREETATAAWLEEDHLFPHIRLLQLLDALSLSLCSDLVPPKEGVPHGPGATPFDLLDVPVTSWKDRTTIEVRPRGRGRIVCDPYPFDLDPLPVVVPAKILPVDTDDNRPFAVRWRATPPTMLHYEFGSK